MQKPSPTEPRRIRILIAGQAAHHLRAEIDPSKPASNGDAAEPSKAQPNVTHPIDCELVDVIEENPDAAADRDDEDEDDEDRSEDTTEAGDDDQNDDQEDRPAATITKSRNHGQRRPQLSQRR